MEPITRKEMFMAKAAGQNVNVPEPITREEKYLAAIAGSGGGAGEMVVTFTPLDYSFENFKCDKTFAEIDSYTKSGGKVRAEIFVDGEFRAILPFFAWNPEYVTFSGAFQDGAAQMQTFEISRDDSVRFYRIALVQN